jgi:DNA-binding MarR family transcriptional regulator
MNREARVARSGLRDALQDSIDRILDEWRQQRPDLDFWPVGLITRMGRVRAHFEASLAALFRQHGLGPADFDVIVTLRRAGHPYRLPQATLMRELALTSGTISVRVDRLQQAGLVEREPDPSDRRSALVRLTDRGLRTFDRVAPAHLANEERLLSALTPKQQEVLADLLRRLLVAFESGATATASAGAPLGLTLAPAHVARELRAAVGLPDVTGLLVTDIVRGSPAAHAGLQRGDLLVHAYTPSGAPDRPGPDGIALRSPTALIDAITDARASGMLRLGVIRGTKRRRIEVPLSGVPALSVGPGPGVIEPEGTDPTATTPPATP